MVQYIVDHFYEIAVGIFMLCFTAWLTWRHMHKKRIIDASDKFNTAILSALSDVYPVPANWPENIDYYLRQKFPAIQTAVEEFKRVIPNSRLPDFNRAWFIYRVGEDGREIDKQCYHQYMGFTIDDHYTDPRKQLKQNVDKLLSFTKP